MLYLFVGLKVPLLMLFWLIWWAVRQEPEHAEDGGEGGSRVRPRPHPAPRLPHAPRRGPHGERAPVPPPRVRPLNARARQVQR
jgi:hypothetical protein